MTAAQPIEDPVPDLTEYRMRQVSRKGNKRRSGSARWQTSRAAAPVGLSELLGSNDTALLRRLVTAGMGGVQNVVCVHCGTIDEHYWQSKQRRWKCSCCGHTFSLTSNTILADRKATWRQHLSNLWVWSSASAALPSLQSYRVEGVQTKHTWVLFQKCRQACSTWHNVGFLAGDLEFDGVHVLGRNAEGKRGKPQATLPDALSAEEQIEQLQSRLDALVQARGRVKMARRSLDPGRRILLVARQRSQFGRGARHTRIRVGLGETANVVVAFAREYSATEESRVSTDGGSGYAGRFHKLFGGHATVDHSKTLVGPGGAHINNAEETARRAKRQERTHIHYSVKYANEYASEMAWRADVWRLSNIERFEYLLCMLLRSPPSLDFRGYVHGHHRKTEILTAVGEVETAPHKPAKGHDPITQLGGRPPR